MSVLHTVILLFRTRLNQPHAKCHHSIALKFTALPFRLESKNTHAHDYFMFTRFVLGRTRNASTTPMDRGNTAPQG
jgi:hypothetical protein